MRPYHSLVLAALVSLALAQELGYDKLSYDELAELSYDKLEGLSFEQLDEIEELSYVRLSYDAMLAAEVSCLREINIFCSFFCLSVRTFVLHSNQTNSLKYIIDNRYAKPNISALFKACHFSD